MAPRAHRQGRGAEDARADRRQNRPPTPDRKDDRAAASAPNAASDDNPMPERTGAERSIPAMAATGMAPRLPPGADPCHAEVLIELANP